MPISIVTKKEAALKNRDKSKSRMRGPRDAVYEDVLKKKKFKKDPKTGERKPMKKGGGVCKKGMGRAYGRNS